MAIKIDKILDFWIYEQLKKDATTWQNARAIVFLLLVILTGGIFYCVYFDLWGNIIPTKRFTNYFQVGVLLSSLIIIKYTSKIKPVLITISATSYLIIITGSFNSGGILSSETVWFGIMSTSVMMFIDKKFGAILAITSISILVYYFYLYNINAKDFKADYFSSGIDYELANIIFAMVVSSICVYILVISNEIKQNKISFLLNSQIKNIDSKYQFLISNSEDIISILDEQLNRTYISPSAKKITGYDPEKLIAEHVSFLMSPSSKKQLASLDLKASAYRGVFEYKSKIGPNKIIAFSSTPIKDETADTILILTREHDITASVKLEEHIKQLRHEIARDFHDGIGNKLATISSTTDLLKQHMEHHSAPMKKLLERIERSSSNLYYEFKDFIWSIDSQEDTLDELCIYLRDIGQNFFEETNINFTSEFDIPKGIILDIKKRRNIVLIAKEAFTNILKHAQASLVKIEIRVVDDFFHISLIDNGVGLTASRLSKSHHGMGMKNIRERTAEIGGVSHYHDSPHGFTIELSIPLKTSFHER
jgi:PAS domain S-box-containing protein